MTTPRSTSGSRRRWAIAPGRVVTALRDSRWGMVCPLLGLAIASAVVLPVQASDRGAWLVWAGFAVAVGSAAGALFVYGLRRWAELQAIAPIPVREVLWPVGRVGLLAVVGINMTAAIPESGYYWRGAVLVTGATLAASTAAGAMYGVGPAAAEVVRGLQTGPAHVVGGLQPEPAEVVPPRQRGPAAARLLALRRLLERLLETVGGLVLLLTLLQSAQTALDLVEDRPPEYVLVFGGFGSLLIALVYVPKLVRITWSWRTCVR